MATVLVVDDNEPIVTMLTELVEEAGHTAIPAMNGLDALDLARQHRPSLIISDIRMPIMDGYAFIQALRADPALAHTLVILTSAHINLVQVPMEAATTFVPKPLDLHLIDGFLQRLP